MPTGFEEIIAALAAAAAAGAAAAPFTGSPNTNLGSQPTIQAGALAADQCLPSAEDQQGEPEQALDPKAATSGNSTAPVTGDRPVAPYASRKPDFELEIIIYGHAPAADAPASSAKPAELPAVSDNSTYPDPDQEPQSPFAPGPPAAMTPQTPWLAPADYADIYQTLSPAFPHDMGGTSGGITGEEFNAIAKKKVEGWLNDYVSDMSAEDPQSVEADPAFDATVVKTIADVGIDMASVAVDPPFLLRVVMRMGTGTSGGVTQIEEGHEVLGTVQVIGEVSSAVLLVLAPIEPGPRTAQMTMLGPERFIDPYGPAHNIVKVESSSGAAASHAVEVTAPDGTPVSTAMPYDLQQLADNVPGYEVVVRNITEPRATDAFSAIDRAQAGNFNGVPGGIGRYGKLYDHCSTYAATVSTAGGIPILGVFGPRATLLWFEYAPQLANPTVPLITGGTGASQFAAPNGAP